MKKQRIVAEGAMRITFSGPGVLSGAIDARELGRTLVSLSDAFHLAQALKNEPEAPKAALTITATGEGSFWVDLLLVVESGAVQAALDALTHKYTEAALNLTTIVGTVFGTFAFIKNRKGKKVIKVEPASDPSRVIVRHSDGTTENIPSDVWLLAKNPAFQKAAKETVKPLSKPGIDEMKMEATEVKGAIEPLQLVKSDYKDFQLTDDSEPEPLSRTEEVYVTPVAANFERGKPWRLSNGANTISAAIEDAEFLQKIDDGLLRIGPTDNFKVLLRTDQEVTGAGKLKSTYAVEQVLRRLVPGEQGEFNL